VSIHLPGKITQTLKHLKPSQWLILAALLHVTITVVVFLIGHFHLLPRTFDEHGIGLTFAIDSTTYRNVILDMAGTLNRNGLLSWPRIDGPLHCRLYALGFYFLGPVFGYNIITAESLNVVYYLGVLVFVYLLGKEVFNARTGLISAAVIGIWPSFVLHSTQLLRDSVSTVFLLAVIFILTVVLKRGLTYRNVLWLTIVSLLLIVLFWLARGNMWNIVIISLGIAALLLAVRMFVERRLLLTNALLLILVFGAALFVPSRIESTALSGDKPPTAILALPPQSRKFKNSFWSRLLLQIRARREGFRVYSSMASNVDADVTFNSSTDVITFLPRAAEIGFLAPFPRMWFEAGAGGRAGRLLSGFETLVMYLLYVPAIICAWRQRHNLGMWFLLLVGSVSVILLGLVVVNIGALYRLRYGFWMLLIVLAVEGTRMIAAGKAGARQ